MHGRREAEKVRKGLPRQYMFLGPCPVTIDSDNKSNTPQRSSLYPFSPHLIFLLKFFQCISHLPQFYHVPPDVLPCNCKRLPLLTNAYGKHLNYSRQSGVWKRINVRKGTVIPSYELSVKLIWECKTKDVVKDPELKDESHYNFTMLRLSGRMAQQR